MLPLVPFVTEENDADHTDFISLAILGEASIEANAQVTSLSKFSYLPRLVPAPQALIRHDRPERLRPLEFARVVSSHSGNSKEVLNHIASLIHHKGPELGDYEVRVLEVEEVQGEVGKSKPIIKASPTGPLSWLAVLGCAMSIVLLGVSTWKEDGMSLLATLTLSLVSSMVGVGSKWKLKLAKRANTRVVPRSDVIVRYPQGAFLIVKCSEEVQRALYWHTEKCEYLVSLRVYRVICLVATLLLMAGVIFLANSTVLLQILWAGGYSILQAAYWAVAALPQRIHWDLRAYKARELQLDVQDQPKTFTEALWLSIAITRRGGWAMDFDICPKTQDWMDWIAEAEMEANTPLEPEHRKDDTIHIPPWQSSRRLGEIMERNRQRREAEKQT
jgi:hypothetical protein